MYGHTLHRVIKHFCRCCLQVVNKAEILKVIMSQNLDESHTNKYQESAACSYG